MGVNVLWHCNIRQGKEIKKNVFSKFLSHLSKVHRNLNFSHQITGMQTCNMLKLQPAELQREADLGNGGALS